MQTNSKISSGSIDELFEAILTLDNIGQCYMFFEDICTISEIKAISQRLEVAKMLKKNITYQEISNITGASTATISRVNRCLNYGTGGYDLALKKLNDK